MHTRRDTLKMTIVFLEGTPWCAATVDQTSCALGQAQHLQASALYFINRHESGVDLLV